MNPSVIFATIALAIGSFMNVLDMTIVNVSLSHIAGDFAVSPDQGTWVITSYAVSEAIFLPLIGWLTKRLGIVKQYLGATLLFTLASVLCGMSPSFAFLLTTRIFQGMVGASMIPLSQTLMLRLYPDNKRGMALGIWAMTIIVAPVVGPVLGGWITDTLSWRWAFYINLPFGIISSFVVYQILKKDIEEENKKIVKEPIDVIGFVFLAIGVGALQIMLDKGTDLDWFSSPIIVTLGIIAFIFLILLFIWEWYHEKPVVNVRLFKDRNFLIGSLSLMLSVLAYFGGVVVLPLWLQNYMGYTAFISGKSTATVGLSIMLVSLILGKYIDRLDTRKVAAVGFFTLAMASMYTAHYPMEITPGYVGWTRFLNGFGVGIFFLSLNTLTLSNISDADMASASGIYNFMRNMGSSIGTSLVVPAWNHTMAFHHEIMAASINKANPYLMSISSSYLTMINGDITKQAATMGINDILYGSGIIALCLIPFIFLAKKVSTEGRVITEG